MKDCKEQQMHGLSYGKLLFRPLSRKKVKSNSCHFCDSEGGNCRCLDCSATAKFCEFCATSMHTEVNILHRVEILKVRKLV